jgi:membrane protease YdiL (CAAX protease family)
MDAHEKAAGWRGALEGHQVTAFFAIAYGSSWLAQLVLFGLLGQPAAIAVPVITFGPTVAAIGMTAALQGRPGVGRLWARMRAWRVGMRWYGVALLVIPLFYIVGTLLLPGALASYAPQSLVVLVVTWLIVLTLGGVIGGPLGEEPGWRGFALPRLQAQLGPLGGTLLLGFVWAGWHLPQFLMPEWADQNGGLSAASLVTFVATVLAIAVILTWIFNHTGGSVLLAMVAHSSVNTSQAVLNPLFPAVNSDLNALIGFGILAIAIVVATQGRLGYPSRETAVSAGLARIPSPT